MLSSGLQYYVKAFEMPWANCVELGAPYATPGT